MERTADGSALASWGRGLTRGPRSSQCRSGCTFAVTGRCPPKEGRGLDLLAKPPAVASLVMTQSIWVLESPCAKVLAGRPASYSEPPRGWRKENSSIPVRLAEPPLVLLGPTSLGSREAEELKSAAIKRVSLSKTCLTNLNRRRMTAALSFRLACTVLAGDRTC